MALSHTPYLILCYRLFALQVQSSKLDNSHATNCSQFFISLGPPTCLYCFLFVHVNTCMLVCSCKGSHLDAKGWPQCHSSISDHLWPFVCFRSLSDLKFANRQGQSCLPVSLTISGVKNAHARCAAWTSLIWTLDISRVIWLAQCTVYQLSCLMFLGIMSFPTPLTCHCSLMNSYTFPFIFCSCNS